MACAVVIEILRVGLRLGGSARDPSRSCIERTTNGRARETLRIFARKRTCLDCASGENERATVEGTGASFVASAVTKRST